MEQQVKNSGTEALSLEDRLNKLKQIHQKPQM